MEGGIPIPQYPGKNTVSRGNSATAPAKMPPFVVITSVVLFLLFLVYYIFTAWHLPRGAGPDSGAHYDAARFIYENGRLAIIPDDVDQLNLTPYGSTRALRPPLSYLVSAGVARMTANIGHDSTFINLRFGSGLMCAAAAAFFFLGLWLLFEHYWIALVGTLLFGLLPQLAFIASYVNDDSGAIFSGTLLMFALIRVLVRGLNTGTAVVFGLAAGLVLLSKFTAWLMLPLAACFMLPFLWRAPLRGARYIAVICVAVVIGGGWWVIFNMSHYGIDDPLLSRVSTRLSEQRAVIADAGHRGYVSKGIGLSDLVLDNYKNFLGESYKATVGHLDWLRIRLGWLQYGLYAIVFLIGISYLPLRKIRDWVGVSDRYDPGEPAAAGWFYWILFLMVLFQLAMYVRFNLYHDVQVQGKYLLPVLAPLLTLFSAALAVTVDFAGDRSRGVVRLPGAVWVVLFVGVIMGSHLHALNAYVVPYYYQDPYVYRLSPFRYLNIRKLDFVKASKDLTLTPGKPGLSVESFGADPWIELKDTYCSWVPVNVIIHVVLRAEEIGELKIYVDQGDGFSEQSATSWRYGRGDNHLIMPMGVSACRAIRIDPASAPGKLVIKRIGFAPIHISQ